MIQKLLLCTDLDRTLLPNGPQPESPGAREAFRRLAARPEVTLAYVTGRHRALVEQVIHLYQLPIPDFVVADVGTSIYRTGKSAWRHIKEWDDDIARDWSGKTHGDLKKLFRGCKALRLQERRRQNVHKLSYYVSLHVDTDKLIAGMQSRLNEEGVNASLIWSVDEPAGVGLLDVLPARATKRHAVEFLMENHGFGLENTLFAGDSGNDIPVLASAIHSILVANAAGEVRAAALKQARENGFTKALYAARGGFRGMNGNYSAGIVEGVVHYLPEVEAWLAGC